jgi:hypothetical protein
MRLLRVYFVAAFAWALLGIGLLSLNFLPDPNVVDWPEAGGLFALALLPGWGLLRALDALWPQGLAAAAAAPAGRLWQRLGGAVLAVALAGSLAVAVLGDLFYLMPATRDNPAWAQTDASGVLMGMMMMFIMTGVPTFLFLAPAVGGLLALHLCRRAAARGED